MCKTLMLFQHELKQHDEMNQLKKKEIKNPLESH